MEIHRNIYFSQAANSWLWIQFRHTGFSFGRGKLKYAHRLEIFAPKHCPEKGYRCIKFAFTKGVK